MWPRALDLMLRHMLRKTSLRVTLQDGQSRTYGDGTGLRFCVRIHDLATVRHLVLNPEMALGKAYMNANLAIEDGDLQLLLELIVANGDDGLRFWWQRLLHQLRIAVRRFSLNNVALRSRRNVAHLYDLSDDLYDLFLDADQQYSCGYFRDPNDTLEQEQADKKHHIARKLMIEPGMRVLDIGCGLGGMACTLARDYGAEVLGIMTSEQQHVYATAIAKRDGLAARAQHLCDYRDVMGTFDRIVSVGMFEHVRFQHYNTYFKTIRDGLSPNWIALVHTIGWTAAPDATNPWIDKYILLGGYIPTISEVTKAIEQSRLWATDIEYPRLHYATTLWHWSYRFRANQNKICALYDERFVRMWRFYLAGCEQTFRHGRQAVFQFQLSRCIDAVPLTRDYLYQPQNAPK